MKSLCDHEKKQGIELHKATQIVENITWRLSEDPRRNPKRKPKERPKLQTRCFLFPRWPTASRYTYMSRLTDWIWHEDLVLQW